MSVYRYIKRDFTTSNGRLKFPDINEINAVMEFKLVEANMQIFTVFFLLSLSLSFFVQSSFCREINAATFY